MKKKYDPQKKHLTHPCVITPIENSFHAYEMRCTKCKKHIKWASAAEYEAYMSLPNDKI